MYKLVIVGTVLATAYGNRHPVNQDIVNEIKAKTTSWEPMEVHENPLANLSIEEIKGLFGALPENPYEGLELVNELEDPNYVAPASFDARTQWPNYIHEIRDQGRCGSCWAFGATEALSDRFTIATNGAVNLDFSPQELVSCDKKNYGCNGGYLRYAEKFFETNGVVADKDYPYTSGTSGQTGSCKEPASSVKRYKCKNGSGKGYVSTDTIKENIQNYGPVETRFNVYSDFMSYKSGVYHHTTGYLEGGHAVKLLGWGNEGGKDYWLCANSWNTNWGINGFFKIDIADTASAMDVGVTCTPDVSSLELDQAI